MGLLDDLMGGGDRQKQFQDFAERYDQGAPYDKISDDEAMGRFHDVNSEMSGGDFEQSARESFSRMSPEEREQFGRQFQEQADQHGQGGLVQQFLGGSNDQMRDPGQLAGMMGNMRQQQPDMMNQMLGGMMGRSGGSSGMIGNPIAKAALSGIAATAAKKFMGGR